MALGHLLTLGHRARNKFQSIFSPSPAKRHIRRIIDQRFLQHNSPYPETADHTSILLSAPPTRLTTLPNGLRVATESTPSSRTATVGVWIDAGSRFESDETHGTARFLEHMIFKGMERRLAGELGEEIKNMKGRLNTYTGREHTSYYAKVMDKDVPKALDILSHSLQNPLFDDTIITRERDVVLRQMEEEVKGRTEEVIFDHLHAAAFGSTPLGRRPAKIIKTITNKDLQNYIATHYTAPRMVIAASGAVKHEEIVSQVEKLFTNLSTADKKTSDLAAKEPALFTGSEVRMRDNAIPLAQLAVAFEGASWTDPDSTALMVMQKMLGSCTSSYSGRRMGSKLARDIGFELAAESMKAFNINYKDTGLFGVYAIAKPNKLEHLAVAIMNNVTNLWNQAKEDDVIRARNQLKSFLLLCMDGTSPVAEDIGRQLLAYGRRISFSELFAKIDAVDSNTVKGVAERFILNKDRAITAVGPIGILPKYNWFRHKTTLWEARRFWL